MGEMDEPVQVIRILFEGINIGLKIAGATYREAKAFASVIAACLKHEKTIGKTNMKKLLKKGGDIKLTRIPEDKLKEFEKLCKKYGILYSVMPDLNKKDTFVEIGFHGEATSRMLSVLEKTGYGEVIGMEEYLKGGDTTNIKEADFPQGESKGKDKGLADTDVTMNFSCSSEEEIEKMMENIKCIEQYKNPDRVGITIDQKLLMEKNGDCFRLKIPYEKNRYVTLSKKDVFPLPNEKSFVAFLDKEKTYEMVDNVGSYIKPLKGKELAGNHFDEISHFLLNLAKKTSKTRTPSKEPTREAKGKSI